MKRSFITFGLILISILIYSQDIIGEYNHFDKIKIGQSFVTRLILKSDSTFEYLFKGDLFNDHAEGTFEKTENIIILNYKTPDYNITKFKKEKTLNADTTFTVEVDEKFEWPNPIAFIRPIELKIKRSKLIIIKTKDNKDNNKKKKLKKIKH